MTASIQASSNASDIPTNNKINNLNCSPNIHQVFTVQIGN